MFFNLPVITPAEEQHETKIESVIPSYHGNPGEVLIVNISILSVHLISFIKMSVWGPERAQPKAKQ